MEPFSRAATVPLDYRPSQLQAAVERGGSFFSAVKDIRPIYWKDDSLFVLDQRELPHKQSYLRCRDASAVAKAIKDMALRGAPLIGGAAAYGYALGAKPLKKSTRPAWQGLLASAGRELRQARPTAVNLMHAIDRMAAKAEAWLLRQVKGQNVQDSVELFRLLKAEADQIFQEDATANRRMADFGAKLLPANATVITHCNTGALATCGIGTAFGVIRRAHELGKIRHVYACETRPYLQGSRLTLWELMHNRIPATLITDNMAAHVMATEKIAAVLVGADRIAANGDAANKIGTYGLAILARHHNIPFYVVAPFTTVDPNTAAGKDIPIEERSSDEVVKVGGTLIAPKGARARHPAFDVTPSELITAIVTDRGVAKPASTVLS